MQYVRRRPTAGDEAMEDSHGAASLGTVEGGDQGLSPLLGLDSSSRQVQQQLAAAAGSCSFGWASGSHRAGTKLSADREAQEAFHPSSQHVDLPLTTRTSLRNEHLSSTCPLR